MEGEEEGEDEEEDGEDLVSECYSVEKGNIHVHCIYRSVSWSNWSMPLERCWGFWGKYF